MTAPYFFAIMRAMQALKRIGLFILALLIIGAGFGIGVYVGRNQQPDIDKISGLYNKETLKPDDVDFGPFWKAWSLLEEKYVDGSKIDPQKLVYGAIAGMTEAIGDPYTVFFPPKENELFESEIKGRFEGIGAEIGMRDNILTIISPLKGSPAAAAGLLAGDKILKIDDKTTNDIPVDEAVTFIRGEKGTQVALTVLRKDEEEPRVIKITRDVIRLPIIEMDRVDGDIFIIKLYNFSENAPLEFRRALSEFARSGSTRLILDLRNNPGGYLEGAIDIASWFFESGTVVAREQFGDGQEIVYRSKGYNALLNTKVVVLVNEGSASASEILAGALRDQRNIKLIGIKTFGKGSVQELTPLTDKTSLKVTIARWLTPSGTSLSENGLDPDYKVELKREDIEQEKDPQLDKALEVIKDM